MNTRLGKPFGLALIMAVGILALMLALGTFNAQKVGADIDPDENIQIIPSTPSPGAQVGVTVAFENDGEIDNFSTIDIELKGWGIPDDIDIRDVQIRIYATGTDLTDDERDTPITGTGGSGLATDVSVSGNVITLEINDEADEGSAIDIDDGALAAIVFRKGAGLTAPALAGSYDVVVTTEGATDTEENAVTVSPILSIDPTSGGGDAEITVSGKAFTDGTGSLFTEALIDPDFNSDGIIDTLIEGTSNPTTGSPNGWALDVDGDDEANYDLLLEEGVDNNATTDDQYKAVPQDEGNLANAQSLGYRISLAPAPVDPDTTPLEGTPMLPAATYDDDEFLKDVTVDDGEFSTTIEAKDLEIGGDKGRSSIRITDAGGTVARATFQVTGTATLGSDSVGKGELLEISLSDWIATLPNEVTIGGIIVADATDAAYDDDDETMAGETLFRDADGEQIDPPDTEDLDEGAFTFYVKVLGEVRLGTKTVVLFDRDADNPRLNSANVEITALTLTVSPTTAVAGQEVTVEGTGFTSGQDMLKSVTVGGMPVARLSNRTNVDLYDVLSGGRIAITFAVPGEVTSGSQPILVTDDTGRVGEATLMVPEPSITLDPTSSRRGSTVTVNGIGFPADATIFLDYGDIDDLTSGRTNNTGVFTASFDVPSSAVIGGEVDITAALDDDTFEAMATHTVPDRAITVTPDVVRSGDTVNIVGTGFPRYTDVEVAFAGGDLRSASARTNQNGDFTAQYVIPGIDPGTHVLQVEAGGIGASWVLSVPAGPTPTVSTAVRDVFAAEIASGNLIVAWQYDNNTSAWTFFDPALDDADNTYTVANSGDYLFINWVEDTTFQGTDWLAGWRIVQLQ